MKTRILVSTVLLSSSILFAGCSSGTNQNADPESASNQNEVKTNISADSANSTDNAANSALKDAAEQYRRFVIEQCDLFVKASEEFVTAVKGGDLAKSRQLYAPTRMYYERIEPIAEALGDLDPNLDAREADVDASEWRGFHRIEKALWVDKKTDGQQTFADQLLADSKLLRAKVETAEIDSNLLITGSVELLNEVSSSKVTGEEELYSHTDLYDFAANVEGADKIFEILKPELQKKDADLTSTIEVRFDEVFQALAPYKKGDGYVLYTELTQEQTKKLSQAIDALAEPLSQMGTILGA